MFEDCFSSSLGYSWCRILTLLNMVRDHVVVIRLMHDWVNVHLKAYSGVSVEERRAWWITLKWYFVDRALREMRVDRAAHGVKVSEGGEPESGWF